MLALIAIFATLRSTSMSNAGQRHRRAVFSSSASSVTRSFPQRSRGGDFGNEEERAQPAARANSALRAEWLILNVRQCVWLLPSVIALFSPAMLLTSRRGADSVGSQSQGVRLG
ncbi:MAG: hypothetical protein ACHQ4G_07155, partial [Opitutales bacterium]